jgi:hypothetical protein
MDLPTCQKCSTGKLTPLPEYGPVGAAEVCKAWVGTNRDCGFFICIRTGEVSWGERIDCQFSECPFEWSVRDRCCIGRAVLFCVGESL